MAPVKSSSVDLCNLGVVYFRQGAGPRAIEVLTRALELDAKNVDALWNLGLVVLDRGDTAQGRGLLTQAAELRPKSLTFQLTLGNDRSSRWSATRSSAAPGCRSPAT